MCLYKIHLKFFFLSCYERYKEKEITLNAAQCYKNPDDTSREVHKQALTGMFGRLFLNHILSLGKKKGLVQLISLCGFFCLFLLQQKNELLLNVSWWKKNKKGIVFIIHCRYISATKRLSMAVILTFLVLIFSQSLQQSKIWEKRPCLLWHAWCATIPSSPFLNSVVSFLNIIQ